MELRHFRYFVAVAEELHFGRAARRLHIAQPPLSRQIQALEHELGMPLFERLPRALRLTPAGEAFLEGVRRVLGETERAVARARWAGRGEAGRLVIAHIDAANHGPLVGRLASAMEERHPEVRLELLQMGSAAAWDALREHRADAAVTYYQPWYAPEFEHAVLLDDPVSGILLSARHPLAARDGLRLAELEPYPMHYFPRSLNPIAFDHVLMGFAERGLRPRMGQQSTSFPVVAAMVAEGQGWVAVTRTMLANAPSGTVYRRFADEPIPFGMALLWRAGDISPALARLVAVARDLADVWRVAPIVGAGDSPALSEEGAMEVEEAARAGE